MIIITDSIFSKNRGLLYAPENLKNIIAQRLISKNTRKKRKAKWLYK